MPTLRFEGFSDDVFAEDHTGQEFDTCASGKPVVFEVKSGDEGLLVFGQYGGQDWPRETPACWMIGVQMLDEDVDLPPWPLRYEASGYSPVLVIHAPDGVVLRCLNAEG